MSHTGKRWHGWAWLLEGGVWGRACEQVRKLQSSGSSLAGASLVGVKRCLCPFNCYIWSFVQSHI